MEIACERTQTHRRGQARRELAWPGQRSCAVENQQWTLVRPNEVTEDGRRALALELTAALVEDDSTRLAAGRGAREQGALVLDICGVRSEFELLEESDVQIGDILEGLGVRTGRPNPGVFGASGPMVLRQLVQFGQQARVVARPVW